MGAARDLDANEVALLQRVLGASAGDAFAELRRQLPYTTVRGGIPTLLDLAVDRSAAAANVEGPSGSGLAGQMPMVHTPEDQAGR